MKKQIKILAVFLFTILLFNCSKDDLENHSNHTHSHTNKDEISFKQFKNETGINKFDYLKKANITKSTDFQARSIESEFITDTIGIKKYVNPIDNKTTYSFKIYPVSESLSSNEYYNLVYEKIGTEWNEIIFFNTEKTNPTDARELESSEMVFNRFSEINGYTAIITYSYHCTQTGDCAGGICDNCYRCVSATVEYVKNNIDDSGSGFNGNPTGSGSGNANSGGGGGEGNGIFIPNPYDGDADPNNAGFMLAGQVAAFTNTLPTNLQSLISNYNFVYPYIVDFCRNNGNSVSTRNTLKITTALNNFYNFQLNTTYTHLTFVNIDRFNFWAFYTFLNNNPLDVNNTKINNIKNFVQSTNDENANDIVDYLFQNKDDEEAIEFVIDFIEYLNSNPNTKLIQYQNWFTVSNEGQDFFYNDSYWQNPNLTFQEQDLPSWLDFYNAYPRNLDGTYMTGADNVYEYVGGEVYQARLNYPNQTKNTCALKVSIALNDSGIDIPNLTDSNGLPITLKGGDDKYYFLNAKHLNNWMKETFGVSPDNPKHKSFASAQEFTDYINTNIANGTPVKGIYFLVKPAGTNISGHADMLFESGLCAAGCNLQLTIDHIDLWILD